MESERIDRLIERYFDGLATPEEETALAAALRSSPGAARRFVRASRFDNALYLNFRRAPAIDLANLLEADREPVAEVLRSAAALRALKAPPTPFGRVMDHVWGPAVAVLAHAAVILLLLRLVIVPREPETESIAVSMARPDAVALDARPAERVPYPAPRPMPGPPETAPDERPGVPDPMRDVAAIPGLAFLQPPDELRRATTAPPSGLFACRNPAQRTDRLQRYAGRWASAAHAAVNRSLDRLAADQRPDGTWQGADGATALALLAFLAQGEGPRRGPHGAVIERALRNLAVQEYPAAPAGASPFDDEALRLQALAEAYGRLRVPQLRAAAEPLMAAWVREQSADGAWPGAAGAPVPARVAPRLQALALARTAGLRVDGLDAAIERAAGYLRARQDPASGLFSATEDVPRTLATASAVDALQRAGRGLAPEVRRGLATLARVPYRWNATDFGNWPLTGCQRATQALFTAGGPAWVRWNDAMAAALTRHQGRDGGWTSPSAREQAMGRAANTALATLALSAYYRYPPAAEAPAVARAAPAPWLPVAALID